MAKWDLYCARGILDKDGNFDPSQIEEGLKIGLNPQPISYGNNPQVIDDFFRYVNLKKNKGLYLKITAHPRSVLLDESAAKRDLDIIVEVNKRFGRPIIKEIVYHAGQVIDSRNELGLRSYFGFEKGACPFSAEEFMQKLNKVKRNYRELFNFGKENGILVLVENVPAIEYEQWWGVKGEKPEELRKDIRWADNPAMADNIQAGLLGSGYDLAYIIDNNGLVCIDIEHLDHSREYLNSVLRTDLNPEEANTGCRINIIKHKPLEFLGARFDPIKFISEFNGLIPVCHLGGQVKIFYEEEGIRKPGSHMAITFPGDENESIIDEKERREQNRMRKIRIEKDLTALHQAGCRKGVFEVHVGNMYGGPLWQKYMKISKKNVKSILDKLD